jgi:hypothetical protein
MLLRLLETQVFKRLRCFFFGHDMIIDSRRYLVVDLGRPHVEKMMCFKCRHCGLHGGDLGLAGTQMAMSRGGGVSNEE